MCSSDLADDDGTITEFLEKPADPPGTPDDPEVTDAAMGNYCFSTEALIQALLGALHGRKHLVTGNNDPPATRALPGWASVQPYMEITVDGVALVLCHYAFRTWYGMAKGALNLHGHSHGRLRPMTRQFDVGVDPRGFRPVTVAQLLDKRLLDKRLLDKRLLDKRLWDNRLWDTTR